MLPGFNVTLEKNGGNSSPTENETYLIGRIWVYANRLYFIILVYRCVMCTFKQRENLTYIKYFYTAVNWNFFP